MRIGPKIDHGMMKLMCGKEAPESMSLKSKCKKIEKAEISCLFLSAKIKHIFFREKCSQDNNWP